MLGAGKSRGPWTTGPRYLAQRADRKVHFISASRNDYSSRVWENAGEACTPADGPSPATHRVWQRRFYDLNIGSEKKRLEKLTYIHHNPVKRGLVGSPDLWPWSSFRFYCLEDTAVLAMDRLP